MIRRHYRARILNWRLFVIGQKSIAMSSILLFSLHGMAFARSPVSISLLEDDNKGNCQWLRIDPFSKKRNLLGTFKGPSETVNAAWSPDGKKGLVWSMRYESPDSKPKSEQPTKIKDYGINWSEHRRDLNQRLCEVDFSTGKIVEIPVPPDGHAEEFGYDDKNHLIGLTIETPIPAAVPEILDIKVVREDKIVTERSIIALKWRGKRYEIKGPLDTRVAVLLHAFRYDKSGWHELETVACKEFAPDDYNAPDIIYELNTRKKLGARTVDASSHYDSSGQLKVVTNEKILKALKQLQPADSDDGAYWASLDTKSGPLYFYCFTVDSDHVTPYIVKERHGKFVPIPGAPERGADGLLHGELDILPEIRNGYLLLRGRWPRSMTGSSAETKIYDLDGPRLIYRSKADKPMLWPY